MHNGLRSMLDPYYVESLDMVKHTTSLSVNHDLKNQITTENMTDNHHKNNSIKNNLTSNDKASSKPLIDEKLLLGLDYGVKKMGMAIGNSLSQTARPFDILAMNNGQPADWDNLIGIIVTWKIHQIIVGHPINMDGSDSILAKRAHKFARRLAHRLIELKLPISVKLFDERLTSVEARTLAWEQGLIKNERDPIDDISACLVLTSYLANPSFAKDIATYQADQ